jgi:hypothetical protein
VPARSALSKPPPLYIVPLFANSREALMSYIKHVLQPGETIRHQGSVHWILYRPPLFLAVVGAMAVACGPAGFIVAPICFAVAIVLALRAWFIRWTTEIAVTDQQVIYAQGFIQRRSVKVHMDKIESGRLRPVGTRAAVQLWQCDDPRHRHDARAAPRHRPADRISQPGHCGLIRSRTGVSSRMP